MIGGPLQLSSTADTADYIEVRPTFNGNLGSSVYYDPDGIDVNKEFMFLVAADPGAAATGRYGWSLEIIEHYTGSPDKTFYLNGKKSIVRPDRPELGAGWQMRDMDELVVQGDGVGIAHGDGNFTWFDSDGAGGFTRASGSLVSYTLEELGGGNFELKTPQGIVSTFSSSGLMLSKSDRQGNTTTYSYIDADGDFVADEIGEIADPWGSLRTFTYDLGGMLDTVTDEKGRVTSFTFDLSGQLEVVTEQDPDGAGPLSSQITEFSYDVAGLLTSITNDDSEVTTYVYDGNGRAKEVVRPGSVGEQFSPAALYGLVDPDSGEGTLLNPAPLLESEDAFGTHTNALGEVTTFKVDRYGNPTKITDDDGNVTLLERDDDGRVTKQTDPQPDGPLGYLPTPITEYAYDSEGNLEQVDYPDGSLESWTYDATFNVPLSYVNRNGNVTLYTLDSLTGLVESERRVVGLVDDLINLETDDVVTQFTYYGSPSSPSDPPAGSLESIEDALGRITEFEYDGLGNLTLIRYAVGTALEAEVTYDYNLDNQLSKYTDELGRETEYEYDAYGRLTKSIFPDPDGAGIVYTSPEIRNVYNSLNQLAKTIDPLSRETVYHYDARGNLTQVDRPDHDGDTNLTTTKFTYNDGDQLEKVNDPLGRVTSFLYDIHGQVKQTTLPDPDGAMPTLSSPVVSTEYDSLGRVISEKDARGQETKYEYGNYGREITITLPDPDGEFEYTYYSSTLYREYDAMGNLVEERDANNNTTTYEYDDLGRLTQVKAPDPDGGGPLAAPITKYAYDQVGNLRFVTDPLGNVTEYQYDARDRQVKVILPDPDGAGPQSAPVTEYEYDDAGQLTKVTDALDRTTEYQYDGLGRLTKTILPDPDGKGSLTSPEISYTYDAAGRKLSMIDPRGNTTAYEYDLHDNLVKVTQPDPDGEGVLTSPVTQWLYDDAGQLQKQTDALGHETTYAYDDLGRLTQVTQPDPDGPGGVAAPYSTYTYDENGNQLTAVSPLGKTTKYAYDYLNRLTSTEDPLAGVTSFTYDGNGNRLSLTDPVSNTTSWQYDALNRVTQENNALYATRYFVYDAASNLIRRTDRLGRVIQFDYDNLHRKTEEQWWANNSFPSSSVYTYSNGYSANEVQNVGFYEYSGSFTSGSFTLTFDGQTTAAIPYNADAEDVQLALEALSNIGVGDVAVTMPSDYGYYQEWEITFTGALAKTDVAQITVDASAVYNGYGTPWETEYTYYEGYASNEVQQVSLSNASGGTFTLSFSGQTTSALDWDATAGEVETALEALSNIDAVSVSGSAGGPFTITFEGALRGENVPALSVGTSGLTNANFQRLLTFEYDLAGQLTEASDPAAVNYYTYDDLGRVTNETMTFAGYLDTISFDSQYDAAGNKTQTEWAFGTIETLTTSLVYDNLNRLTQLTRSSDQEATFWHRAQFSYNALGQFTQFQRFVGDNTTPIAVADTNYAYDGLNRLTSILHATGMTTWAGYDYTYDAGSRITSVDSFLDGLSEYDYDDTDQLVGADHTGSTDETYDYDANGNRDTGYTTGTNNQLESDGTYYYTYDAEGNRVTRTNISTGYVTEYTWDHRNRLVAVTEKDDMSNVLSVVENSYDAFNRWIRRSVDADGPGGAAAVDAFFAYEGNQLTLEIDGDDGSDLSHVYSWGPSVDQLIADITHGAPPNFALTDRLGTPRDFVEYDYANSETDHVGHRIYDSFGNLTSSSVMSSLIGFTARPFDAATGLQNNLNRWFDPTPGRWLSEDPIGFLSGEANLTRYVSNNPTGHTDSTGLILEVDGKLVQPGDPIYKRIASTPIAKEILDVLIASNHSYKYSMDALLREIAARKAIVDAAHEIAAKIRSGQIVFPRRDIAFDIRWGRTPVPGKRANASTQLLAFLRAERITTECREAVNIVFTLGMFKWLGTDKYNNYYKWLTSYPHRSVKPFPPAAVDLRFDPAAPPDNKLFPDGRYRWNEDILPGDQLSFVNPGAASPWHGENAIYLGNGKYFAHPFGIVGKYELMAELSIAYLAQGNSGEPSPFLDIIRASIGFEDVWTHCQ